MKKIFFLLVSCMILISSGHADQTAWILCQPNDWVNARAKASTRSQSEGRFETGDVITLDGKEKNGFVHVVDVSFEVSECWVYAGYVSYAEPVVVNKRAVISSSQRVRARKTIDGKRRRWLEGGTSVYVYYIAGDWSVTNEGFVKTEYLRFEGVDLR